MTSFFYALFAVRLFICPPYWGNDVCAYEHPQVLVLADEIYEHLTYDTPHKSFAALPGKQHRIIYCICSIMLASYRSSCHYCASLLFACVCMYLRVCAFVWVYVFKCVRMCVYLCVCICEGVCIYVCAYVRVCVFMCAYVSVCVYLCVHMCGCMHLCVCTCYCYSTAFCSIPCSLTDSTIMLFCSCTRCFCPVCILSVLCLCRVCVVSVLSLCFV
jgi:hypothetical protein